MGYQKLLIDNVTCSRRFHITFDSDAPKIASVEVKCPYCDIVIFAAENHPEVRFARQENLIQTGSLSDNIIRQCDFTDEFSKQTQHAPGTSTKHL